MGFSNFPLYPESWPVEVAIKIVLFNAVWIPVHIVWMQVGVTLKRLELSTRTQRAINVAMALSLVGVVIIALFELRTGS